MSPVAWLLVSCLIHCLALPRAWPGCLRRHNPLSINGNGTKSYLHLATRHACWPQIPHHQVVVCAIGANLVTVLHGWTYAHGLLVSLPFLLLALDAQALNTGHP